MTKKMSEILAVKFFYKKGVWHMHGITRVRSATEPPSGTLYKVLLYLKYVKLKEREGSEKLIACERVCLKIKCNVKHIILIFLSCV